MTFDPASNLLYQKLFVGLISLVVSIIFGLLPYHLSRKNDAVDEQDSSTLIDDDDTKDPTMPPKWLSLATSFGGGVFLGAGLLHLLPESSEVLDQDFPRANLLCCIGFLMVLGLEEILPHVESKNNELSASDASTSLALVAALSFHSLFDGLAIGSTTTNGQLKAVSIAILAHKPVSAFALGSILVCKRLVALKPQKLLETEVTTSLDQHDMPHQRQRGRSSRRLSESKRIMAYNYFKYTDGCEEMNNNEECACVVLTQLQDEMVNLTNGYKESELINTSHEGYGSLPKAQQSKPDKTEEVPLTMFIHIIFFSTTSLIGTIIGAVGLQYIENSTSSSNRGATVAAVCQSLAAGSFLYAATMEALVKERGEHHKRHFHHHGGEEEHKSMERTNRVGAAMFGVVAMASIKLLEHD